MVPDAWDSCPTVFNPDRDPQACREEVVDVRISLTTDVGRGSGLVSWRATHEVTPTGFNVVVIGREEERIRMNDAPLPCTARAGGESVPYRLIIPKHKNGRNLHVEMPRGDFVLGTFGPAEKVP